MASGGVRETDETLKAETCRSHSEQLLCIYCKTCSCFICRDCSTADHKQHDLSNSVYDADKTSESAVAEQTVKEQSSLKGIFKRLKLTKNILHRSSKTKHSTNTTVPVGKVMAADPNPDRSGDKTRGKADKVVMSVEEQNYSLYVGKYDYIPRTKADLGFKKKDLLYVVNTDDKNWWFAKAKHSGEEGYIPSNFVAKISMSLEVEDWFCGDMRRVDAEKQLQFKTKGSFLVWNSIGHQDAYHLSVKDEERVKHYLIRVLDNGEYLISRRISFATIPELIDYYSLQADGLCVNLISPCITNEPPPTVGLSKEANQVWDIERSSIHFFKRLGASFGTTVWEGQWNKVVPIAVKVFNSDTLNASEFRKAVALMRNLRHPNLVQVLAVCTRGDPIYMITELMTGGSLLDYLRGDGRSLKFPQLMQMATQIADGMVYLEENMYPHGNLAARNVLLSANLICKVADYGMTQGDIYKDRSEMTYSLKWVAPEAILSKQFTVKSDVWSFGILLYEVITYGRSPYPGVSDKVLQEVMNGYRMPCPNNCPQQLYEIMKGCWEDDAASRPTFETLQWRLQDVSNDIDSTTDT